MSRDLIIAVLFSLLLHGGFAVSGYLFKDKPAPVAKAEEIPTIALDLPPPPEPEEPETVDNTTEAPAEVADLAPPMQQDIPSAAIDTPFSQPPQPPVPEFKGASGPPRIPPTPRPASLGAGAGLKGFFDLAALDKKPSPTFQPKPPYPFELKRSGIEGEVVVSFIVDSLGNVLEPYIVRSTNPGFEASVLSTVVKWRFKPGQKGGAAVNTRNVQILIPFSLKAD